MQCWVLHYYPTPGAGLHQVLQAAVLVDLHTNTHTQYKQQVVHAHTFRHTLVMFVICYLLDLAAFAVSLGHTESIQVARKHSAAECEQ